MWGRGIAGARDRCWLSSSIIHLVLETGFSTDPGAYGFDKSHPASPKDPPVAFPALGFPAPGVQAHIFVYGAEPWNSGPHDKCLPNWPISSVHTLLSNQTF